MENTKKTSSKGQEIKKKIVKDILNLFDKSSSVIIASIKGLPSKQFHSIKKEIRENGEVKVFKKSTVIRALEASEKKGIKELKNHVKEDIAFIFSKLDPFAMSAILSDKKSPVKAKTGQIAEEEIAVEPGPTDFTPGPVISELGSLGIKIAIEDGKINIRERKVIAKKGEAISSNASAMMAKLDIKPFAVGYIPLAAYDKKEDKIYVGIKIDKDKTLKDLKGLYGKSLAFAVKIGYACKESIKHLLMKAFAQEKAIEKLIKTDAPTQDVQINNQGGP